MEKQLTTEKLGMNRTGIMASPLDSSRTTKGADAITQPLGGDEHSGLGENRLKFIEESGILGTVPLPASIKGALSAVQEKILGGDHTFIDKLGERIAFERTGYRLYDALLIKHESYADKRGLPPREEIERFRLEELEHFRMLVGAMNSIGGDPTSMTPAADVAGVAGSGWVQIMADPRTDFKQCLEIILQAELVDNSCWEVLVALCDSLGLAELSERFSKAKEEEGVHLSKVKQWVMDLNLNPSGLLS